MSSYMQMQPENRSEGSHADMHKKVIRRALIVGVPVPVRGIQQIEVLL